MVLEGGEQMREYEMALEDRDKATVTMVVSVVTRLLLEPYPRMEVLVLQPSVNEIERDALLDLPALEAVVVDVRSRCKPEECDYGKDGDIYRHVPVFRTNTTRPPRVSLISVLFKAGYPVPILLHSKTAGMEIKISDGRVLRSTREGYELRTLRLAQGRYYIGYRRANIIEWDEEANHTFPKDDMSEDVDLVIPYGVYIVKRGSRLREERTLKYVHIPSTVKIIGACAFHLHTNLKCVDFEPGVKEIHVRAFGQTGIERVILPASLLTIAEAAFAGSTIKEVNIPSSVTKLDSFAFSGCKRLKTVIFADLPPIPQKYYPMRPQYSEEQERCQCSEAGDLVSSEMYDSEGERFVFIMFAFYNNPDADGWSTPPQYRKVSWAKLEQKIADEDATLCRDSTPTKARPTEYNWKEEEFMCSPSLKSIEYVMLSIYDVMDGPRGQRDSQITSISQGCFTSTKLRHITIPKSVVMIEADAFLNSQALSSIRFEDGSALQHVGNCAFRMTALGTVTFPPSVLSFGEDVFRNVFVMHIEVPGTATFHRRFLNGAQGPGTVCFYNCVRAPDIDFGVVRIETREGGPLAK